MNYKSIKIRIYPSKEQVQYIVQLFGCCRFVFNKCLEYEKNSYRDVKKSASWGELGKYITFLKKTDEYSWLNDVHSHVIAQSLIDLNTIRNEGLRILGQGMSDLKSVENEKKSPINETERNCNV